MKKTANERNTAQLILNSFLCCFKLRSGSFIIACVHIWWGIQVTMTTTFEMALFFSLANITDITVISVLGIWHSLYFGQECAILGCVDIATIHYIWLGVSTFSLVISSYLLLCLTKRSCRAITVWIVWNGFVSILRFTIIILILALNVNNENIFGNIFFHFLALPVTLYSIIILLSYNQEVSLVSFGYYQRYCYPRRRFPLVIKDEDYLELDDEEDGEREIVVVDEEFV